MKIIAVVVVVLFALAVSQPHPRCASPKQWEGVGVQLGVNPYFKLDYIDDFDISYDSTNQKMRQTGRITTYNNSSKPVTQLREQILDYNKKIHYEVNLIAKTCQKFALGGPFPVVEVPASAHYLAELWIGIEGQIGAGFETELWAGAEITGRYATLWSQVGCFPVMNLLYNNTSQSPWETYVHYTVYNVTLGIKDPNVFNPPSYC